MEPRLTQWIRAGSACLIALCIFAAMPHRAEAAPYAAMVIDARSGEVLHSNNADTRLHPASLTKMMTLYIAFEAVENGEVSLDEKVRISKNAAAEPPSKLGLREGQSIAFRYLIRAASVKSANDAATAIGETLEGSEAAFARRMTRTAKALGMTRTTFKNAHGLTEEGHLSTARDMTLLGRRLFFDYPQYYNLFSRRTTHAGIREVANTNRRLLGAYKGADGIKTGYTRAAGFNLVASADRGGERIIATVFGGRSSASRNAKVAELLDLGFSRAPTRVAINRPAPVPYPAAGAAGVGRSAPAIAVLARSLRPRSRPGAPATTLSDEVVVALKEDIKQAVAEVADTPKTAPSTLADAAAAPQAVRTISVTPQPRPARQVAEAAPATPAEGAADPDGELRVVTRLSTSGGRHWGINVGRYGSRYQAERMLLKTALLEIGTLNDALRKVVRKPRGFEANFVGMSAEQASLACRRLAARDVECDTFGPG